MYVLLLYVSSAPTNLITYDVEHTVNLKIKMNTTEVHPKRKNPARSTATWSTHLEDKARSGWHLIVAGKSRPDMLRSLRRTVPHKDTTCETCVLLLERRRALIHGQQIVCSHTKETISD